MSPSQVMLTNIRVENLTLAQIGQRFGEPFTLSGYAPSDSLWLVSMDGEWIQGGFISSEWALAHPTHHLTVFVDGETGNVPSLRTGR